MKIPRCSASSSARGFHAGHPDRAGCAFARLLQQPRGRRDPPGVSCRPCSVAIATSGAAERRCGSQTAGGRTDRALGPRQPCASACNARLDVERMPMGIQLFDPEPRNQARRADHPRRRLLAALPAVLTGWRPAWLAKAGLHQLGAEGLEIEVTEPVIPMAGISCGPLPGRAGTGTYLRHPVTDTLADRIAATLDRPVRDEVAARTPAWGEAGGVAVLFYGSICARGRRGRARFLRAPAGSAARTYQPRVSYREWTIRAPVARKIATMSLAQFALAVDVARHDDLGPFRPALHSCLACR